MAARPATRLLSLLLVTSHIPACFADATPSQSSGASGDGTSTGDEDATTASAGSGSESSGGPADDTTGGVPTANLLLNGSFESWATTPVSWLQSGEVMVAMGGSEAYEGAQVLRMINTGYGEVRQRVDVPGGLPTGTVLAVQMAYRHVDGATAQPGVDVFGIRDNGEYVLIPAIATPTFSPRGWTLGGGNVTTLEPFVAIQLSLVAGGEGPQTVEIDDVTLTIVE
jgi:hypothetical protein